jgi:hypothetical protein
VCRIADCHDATVRTSAGWHATEGTGPKGANGMSTMKLLSRRGCALLVVLACSAPAIAEQPTEITKTSESLTIGVSVDPTCTVAVRRGEEVAERAVGLSCRNMRDNQPEPIVFETTPRDGHDVVLIRF